MKKERPQIPINNFSLGAPPTKRKWPSLTFKFQTLFAAFMVLFFLVGNNSVKAQAPTSTCDDPIEVSSTICGNDTSPNTPSGLWGGLPASGMQMLLFGFPGGAFIEIDFNCLADDMDAVGDLEIRLASSAFVSGSNPCSIYLENVYDVRDSDGNEALELLTILVEFTGCNSDTEAPIVTCMEFTGSGSSCPNLHDPNTPNGTWTAVPASGTFISAVGGGVAQGLIDLNGCVTDNMSALSEMEYTLLASYSENEIPGCSKDIINELQIRDACGNVSPTTVIFRGTITYSGPPPVLTCPADVILDCGDSIDPMDTGMATATSGCGTPTVSYIDGAPSGSCGATIGGVFIRTWTATDGCGQTSVCNQNIGFNDGLAPTSSCADPIEITADFCPVGIGPGTPNGGWGNIPASGIIQLQVGPVHMVDLNCLMDDVSHIGDLEIRLASSQFIGTPTSCLRVIEAVYDIRDAAGNIAPELLTIHFTLENDDPITQTPSAGITCGETLTMQSQMDYVYTVEPPTTGVSSNQDCRSGLIWATPIFETPCGDFTDFSISFSAESSPAPSDLPDNMVFGGTSGNPIPDFGPTFGYIPPSQYFYGSAESCAATTRVTYNLTDECGKTFTCFFLVEVEDNQDPIAMCNDIEVALVAGSYTLTPADEDAIGGGSTDNCGIDASLSGILPTTFTTADIGDNLVTYNVTDNCGNTSACVATVTVVCPLVLDCSLITDEDLECRTDLPPVDFDLVTAIDSCGDLIKSALTIIPGNSGCPGDPVVVTREYFVNDGINSESCMQTFTIESTIPPTIDCPADVVLECDEDISPANTGMATGMASCSNFTLNITFSDASTQGMAGCSQYQYMITRTWFATDGCGRVTSCDQIIEVNDTTAPMITDCPGPVTIECDEDSSPANTGMAMAMDNCSAGADLVVTFSDVSTQGMGCSEFSYIITRTWTATDACGLFSTCSQIITVEDNNPPTITVPADVTVECDQPTDPGATGNATASMDNCAADNQLTVTFSDVSTQTPTGCGNDTYMITRTWVASDPCGNTAAEVQIIMVEDTTPPTIVCPADLTIECDEDTSPANTGTAVAVDACAPEAELTITFADASTQTATGCGQYQYVITRTWTATDPCGNATNCVQVIEVEDTTAPDIVCPADVSLSCTDSTDPADTGIATGSDNCSAVAEVIITSTDISTQTNEGCGQFTYEIFRTWLATDACGNTTTCVQNIAVADTEAPVITCPAGQTLSCFETVPAPLTTAADFIAAGGTISDNCTVALTDFTVISQNDDNGGDNCPGNARTVIRTYFVADACGNTTTCTQTFTYLASTQGPVITSVLPTCYKYCASLANPMEEDITYDTDCSFGATVNIAGPTQIGQDNCPGTIYRYTYTVTDDCGRTSAPVTRDFIIGNDGPTIECAPFNLLLECGDPNNSDYIADHIGTVTANSSCELGYTINHFPQNFNNITCNSSTVVTFVATDDCGRTASCTTTINISDNTAPEITSTYVDGVCNEAICGSDVNFFFNFWKGKVLEGLTATDACDSNVSFSTVGPNSPNQNCPDGTAETVITWVANDNCGNESEISYSFFVVPADEPTTGPSIMGMVATEEGETVESVTVTLEGPNNYVATHETEEDGLYGFENLLLGNNYEVTPFLDEDPLNGVSSFDLVLMTKHILEIESLDSPYKMIAADVNNSGFISTMDIVALRKIILHVDEGFQNNTSWRFVETAYVFPEPTNPFGSVFPEEIFINGLTAEEQHDFVGVKIGDVNGSVVANAQADAEDRTFDGQLNFGLKNRELKAGETYDVDFLADDFVEMMGYQFTLNYDATQVEFVGLEAGSLPNMTESNFGLSKLAEGMITTSWTNQKAVTIMDEATLFTLRFTAKTDGTLSDVISVGSRYTVAEAYRKVNTNTGVALEELGLRFDTDEFGGAQFELHQNIPNPFADETMIGFNLPSNSNATITIYDISGRTLKQVEGEYTKGYHTINVAQDELKGSTGILYYELATPTQRVTKKMTLIRR